MVDPTDRALKRDQAAGVEAPPEARAVLSQDGWPERAAVLCATHVEAGDRPLFCQYCQSLVGARSKHCRICNTCVEHFDHQCAPRWLR